MAISFPPNPSVSGSDVPTSIAYSATNVVLDPANASRAPGGYIVNNATKILWVTFTGVAATTAAPATAVPANGGAIDIPGNYTGAINGIWVAAGTGSCVVHEFTNQ